MSQDTNQINVFRKTVVALVRGEASDLTARQLGVFLTCYLESNAQTVRGLAMPLKVSKPAISRSLDRLAGFDLIRRKPDPIDRRSVIVVRTPTGIAYLRVIRDVLTEATQMQNTDTKPTA